MVPSAYFSGLPGLLEGSLLLYKEVWFKCGARLKRVLRVNDL